MSFAIYLSHALILGLMQPLSVPSGRIGWLVFLAAVIALAYGLGRLSTRFVEQPAKRAIRRRLIS